MAGIDPISIVADATEKIISLFKADPTVKAQITGNLELTALQGQIQEVLAQIQVNAVEAANKSVWVSGWRPCVGWVCAGALAVPPLVYLAQCAWLLVHGQTNLPTFNTADLTTMLFGLLGLGGMRTYEKVNGVDPQNK